MNFHFLKTSKEQGRKTGYESAAEPTRFTHADNPSLQAMQSDLSFSILTAQVQVFILTDRGEVGSTPPFTKQVFSQVLFLDE